MKDKLSKCFKSIQKNKMFGAISIAIIVLFGVGYYGSSFVSQQNLQFTQEDSFILFLIGFILVFMSVLFIWLIFDRQKLYNLLIDIYDQITDNHHNDVLLRRDTQELIMKLCSKQKDGVNNAKE